MDRKEASSVLVTVKNDGSSWPILFAEVVYRNSCTHSCPSDDGNDKVSMEQRSLSWSWSKLFGKVCGWPRGEMGYRCRLLIELLDEEGGRE